MGKRFRVMEKNGTNQTIIAAVSLHGLDAPWVIDGAINGEMFHCWGWEVLCPTLQPGDLVRWDKPTVSLGVTYAVVCTYGCDDGRISPTRCAIIDAGLDGRSSLHRSYKTPPAAAGSAHVGLAAASRLASTAAPEGSHRSRTTPPSAITPCGDAPPAMC